MVNGFFLLWLCVIFTPCGHFSFPADRFDFLSHREEEEVTTALMFLFFLFKFLNLLSACCGACLSSKRLLCRSVAVLVTSNPGKTERTETLLSQVYRHFRRTCFTSCSLLGSGAAAWGSERRMLSAWCCCLCLFFSSMFSLKAQVSCLLRETMRMLVWINGVCPVTTRWFTFPWKTTDAAMNSDERTAGVACWTSFSRPGSLIFQLFGLSDNPSQWI